MLSRIVNKYSYTVNRIIYELDIGVDLFQPQYKIRKYKDWCNLKGIWKPDPAAKGKLKIFYTIWTNVECLKSIFPKNGWLGQICGELWHSRFNRDVDSLLFELALPSNNLGKKSTDI